jgi:hypothetical protein
MPLAMPREMAADGTRLLGYLLHREEHKSKKRRNLK